MEAAATEKFLVIRKLMLARFDQHIGSILGDISCVARFYTIDKGFRAGPSDLSRGLAASTSGEQSGRSMQNACGISGISAGLSGQLAVDTVLGFANVLL